MTVKAPFQPKYGSNQVLTSSAASASVNIDPVAKQICVVNSGAALAHFRTFSSQTTPQVPGAATATTADMPVLAGQSVTVSKGALDDSFAHVSATGTTLHVIAGEGFGFN